MFVRGLEEAGPCPTRESFIERLRAVDGYDAGGLVGTTDFAADFGRLKECYAFVRVNEAGDRFEVVEANFCGSRLEG
nr:ABC transporter substrate-binding protein [Micromonospora sp. DSM 115978]